MTHNALKACLAILMAFVITVMLTFTGSSPLTVAQGAPTATLDPDDEVVRIEIVGEVESVSATELRFVDGTQVIIRGLPIPPGVRPGITIRIVVYFDGDQLILIEITIVIGGGTPEPTLEPTLEPTVEPTVEPTLEPTVEPTVEPTLEPTIEPTLEPTIEPTFDASCPEARGAHPVGLRLAEAFGVSYEEIMSWKCLGYGFGEIAKAYVLAAESGLTVVEIFALRASGLGWGQVVREVRGKAGGVGGVGSVGKIKIKIKIDGSSPAIAESGDGSAPGKSEGKGKGKGKNDDKDKGKGPKK
jgi:PT repeat